jgi:hypothetical protein
MREGMRIVHYAVSASGGARFTSGRRRPPSIPRMHLRRAILLFAIVLGLAAVVASISRPGSSPSGPAVQPSLRGTATERQQTTPTVAPGNASPPGEPMVSRTFRSWLDQTRRIEANQSVTVSVLVDRVGQVSIPDLGLTDSAEPVTPAEFDVFTPRSGRYPIVFMPAAATGVEPAGTLVVRAAAG